MSVDNKRTKGIVNNIGLSMIGRLVTTIVSFLVVPLTIDYINPTQYGIWLTLSSIIGWVGIFDMGLGQGFRNRFAEARALGDDTLAHKYVSTTYFAVGCVVSAAYILLAIFSFVVNWSSLLGVPPSYQAELSRVFLILGSFFCLKMVVGIFGTMLTADHKPGITSLIQALGSLLSLLSIYIITNTTEGSLTNLALFYSGVPCLTMALISLIAFVAHPIYKKLRPTLSYIRIKLIKDIMSLGVQFFVIHICMLIIFQLTNIVISRELGPLEVTKYNISYKYFNILYVFVIIVINPFWSAFTEAYTLKDYKWMKKMVKKLESLWLLTVLCGLIMLALAPIVYKIWIKDKVDVDFYLNLCMYIYYLLHILGAIYMYLINGIGAIRIQMIIYILFAFLSWPLLVWSCRTFGVCGILLSPATVYLIQALLARIQIHKLINGTARGIWIK